MTFEEANAKFHPVEDQWHYPILTRYGYEPLTKTAQGFVRYYQYKHPVTQHELVVNTGVNAEYWSDSSGGFGYHLDLEPYLKRRA